MTERIRPPRPRRIRRPDGEKSMFRRWREETERALIVACIIGMIVETARLANPTDEGDRAEPTSLNIEDTQKQTPTVSPQSTGKPKPPEELASVRELKKVHNRLVSAQKLDRPALFHPNTNAVERCQILARVIESHRSDFVTVGEYLGVHADHLANVELREMMREQMRTKFKMTPDEIRQSPDRARARLLKNFDSLQGSIAGCGFLVQVAFGTAANRFPSVYSRRTALIVREVMQAAERKEQGAEKAADALARIAQKLETFPQAR